MAEVSIIDGKVRTGCGFHLDPYVDSLMRIWLAEGAAHDHQYDTLWLHMWIDAMAAYDRSTHHQA